MQISNKYFSEEKTNKQAISAFDAQQKETSMSKQNNQYPTQQQFSQFRFGQTDLQVNIPAAAESNLVDQERSPGLRKQVNSIGLIPTNLLNMASPSLHLEESKEKQVPTTAKAPYADKNTNE